MGCAVMPPSQAERCPACGSGSPAWMAWLLLLNLFNLASRSGSTALMVSLDYARYTRTLATSSQCDCASRLQADRRAAAPQQRGAVGVVHRAAPLPAGLFAKHIGSAPGFINPPSPPGYRSRVSMITRALSAPRSPPWPLGHLKLTVKVIGDGSEGAADGGNAAHHHAGFDHQGGVFGVEGHQGVEVAPGDGGVTGLDQGAKGCGLMPCSFVSGGRAGYPPSTGHQYRT